MLVLIPVLGPSSMPRSNALLRLWAGPPDLPRPLQLERRMVLGRWIGIAVFTVALALHPLANDQVTAGYLLLLVAAAYNLALTDLLRRRRTGVLLSTLPTIGDGLLCAAMFTLVAGFDSPFYAVLYAVSVSGG